MTTKIQQWGNSLGLRIPKAVAAEAGVGVGSEVDLSVANGDLIVRPTRPPKADLRRLLHGVTSKNLHESVETGRPVGRESW